MNTREAAGRAAANQQCACACGKEVCVSISKWEGGVCEQVGSGVRNALGESTTGKGLPSPQDNRSNLALLKMFECVVFAPESAQWFITGQRT